MPLKKILVTFNMLMTMRKTFVFTAIALAALSVLVSCNKEQVVTDEPAQNGTLVLTINAGSPETKTVFGEKAGSGYPITWAASGEEIELVELLTPTSGDPSYKGYASSNYTLSNANATAIFSAEVDALSTEGTYDYHALYPQSAYKSANTSYKDLYAIIPDTQTPPSDASPAAAATLLYAGSTGHSAQPTSALNMDFSHITAYGKMTVKNASDAFADSGETISSVSVSVPTGGIYYYWETANISSVNATKKDAVTINTDNIDTSGDFVVWFACAPYSLAIDDELTVSVTTDANTYSRTITMTKAMTFESGKVSKFSVNMSTAAAADDLSGNYLIVSTDETNPWYAMTNEVSSNVYLGASTGVAGSTDIDVDDATTNFSSFCSDAYVWKLAKVSGGYTLQNALTEKYATVNSDNNRGEASDTPVTLTVADAGNGIYTVTSQTYTSRSLQFNYNSGNTRFAFYASTQKALYFVKVSSYKKTSVFSGVPASTISLNPTETYASSITVNSGSSLSYSSSDEDVATVSSAGVVTAVAAGTAVITVNAAATGDYLAGETSFNVQVNSGASTSSETITFSEKGYSNAQNVTNVSGTTVALVFAQGSNASNAPKYYTTGTGVRTYTGNTITVTASNKTITKIEFTFHSTYSMTCSSVSPGTYSDGTWTGSGTSVVFTPSNTNRIQTIKVTYED